MNRLLPATLKQLGTIATDRVGDCVGFRWQRSPCSYRRIVACYFRSRWAALRFARVARHQGCLVFDNVRWERLDADGQPLHDQRQFASYTGWRVIAIAIPDLRRREGWQPAPPFRDQPGGQRIADGGQYTGGRAWWDEEIGDGAWVDHDRYDDVQVLTNDALGDDADLERDLDRISAEVTAWWQATGRSGDPYTYSHAQASSSAPTTRGSVEEMLATLRTEAQQHLAKYEQQRAHDRVHTILRRDNDEIQAALRGAKG